VGKNRKGLSLSKRFPPAALGSKQERAFELFGQEKYFDGTEGKTILQRMQLSLDDLKAKDYGEPFVFWPSPRSGQNKVRLILIVENLSFFHTCRRAMIHGQDFCGFQPDMLIYGEGKKIEKSLSFLREILTDGPMHICYAGDMDPEGWGIYVRLKNRYPEYPMQLALPIYRAMAANNQRNDMEKNQQESVENLHEVLQEIGHQDKQLHRIIESLWKEKKRIPQETLTIETLSKIEDGEALLHLVKGV
jgi:hypothetical protein